MKKLNFIDYVIILFIVAVLAFGWFIFNKKPVESNTFEFEYSILLREIPIETVNAIQNNCDIFDGVKIINIGKIKDSTSKETKRYTFNEITGEYVESIIPDTYDVTITVSANGTKGNLSYFVNEYEILVGKSVDVKSLGFVGHGFISSVNDEVK